MYAWPYKPYQREINWTDPFYAVLGAYIILPELTLLWRDSRTVDSELYQFSAKSDRCNTSFCADRYLRLIDFRHAMLIMSDIRGTMFNIHEPYTPEKIAEVCLQMKEMSKYYVYGRLDFIMDGVAICSKNGNHVVLFTMNCISECVKELPSISEYVQYAIPRDMSPLIVTNHIIGIPRLFIMNATELHDCDYTTCEVESTQPLVKCEMCNNRKDWNASVYTPVNCQLPEGFLEGIFGCVVVTGWKLQRMGLRHPNMHLPDPDKMSSYNKPEPMYISINWESFLPVYGSFIEIPPNTVFWRGYDTLYPAITDRPAYFGNKETAEAYAETSDDHALGFFATSKPLKLIDIRFLKVLLTDLFRGHSNNIVTKTTIAFGLCSLFHQINLMKTMYIDAIKSSKEPGYANMLKSYKEADAKNPEVEQPGVRVAETFNDGWVMACLREIFDGVADGFVAPRLFSPYHENAENYLHPEIIVFNPLKSGIVQLDREPKKKEIEMKYIINQQFPSPMTLRGYTMETTYVGCGGKKGNDRVPAIPAIEKFNALLNHGDPDAINHYNEALKEGKELRKNIVFSNFDKLHTVKELPDFPSRSAAITPFDDTTNKRKKTRKHKKN